MTFKCISTCKQLVHIGKFLNMNLEMNKLFLTLTMIMNKILTYQCRYKCFSYLYRKILEYFDKIFINIKKHINVVQLKLILIFFLFYRSLKQTFGAKLSLFGAKLMKNVINC